MSTPEEHKTEDGAPVNDSPESTSGDDTASDTTGSDTNVRAARKAQREAERAARAQRKADAARERAMEAARAGGLFAGMESAPGSGAMATTTSTSTTTSSSSTPPAAPPGTPSLAGASEAGFSPEYTDTRSAEPMDPARKRTLIKVLAALSVVFLVITGLSTWQYIEARDATAVEEQIANAPSAATDSAREIATQMFTYDHRTVDADLAAVRDKLTEPALGEFVKTSMPAVTSAAQQQEATVYATVAAAAPQEVVDADNVTVLVMLNRMVSTKDAPEAASSASRLSMKMKREGDTWKLSKLDAL